MLFCQALVACSLRLGACCLWLFIFFLFFIQLQVVPGPLCSGPSVPYYHQSFFLVRGSISFLTRRRISSIASAILFNDSPLYSSLIYFFFLIVSYIIPDLMSSSLLLDACGLLLSYNQRTS